MHWLVRLPQRLKARIIPTRASTQTWMILTFLLFVGIAVVAVGLYMTFVLQDEVEVAINQTLYQRTERVADRIDAAQTNEEVAQVVREAAQVTGFRITIIRGDSVLWDVQGPHQMSEGGVTALPEVLAARSEGVGYAHRDGLPGAPHLYCALRRASGHIVRVGSADLPLVALIRRMQVVLAAGMILALLLAVLGSWIAAQRVTRPLQAIRNSARSISEGKLDATIRVESRATEFQDLEKSLNRMSDSFRQKIDDLHSLARLQNEFIGNVSHEVRNPIFAVGGYLEALASPHLNAAQREFYAEKGLINLQRLNNLFNDLIEIARLEYREDLIKARQFDLMDLLDEIGEVVQPKAAEKGLDLKLDNPSTYVLADRNRIRQVLINLIENAIAYSDEGTVRCRIRRHLDKVRIEVIDTGRGIPDEHLEHIFQRFYRVDPDRSRKSGGTGLGLSIVKQILHAHGEQIHVESTVGRGTRFWFSLPFAPQEAPVPVV